ncbi:hypothetical protein UlMin_010240 [Ulmus minor]
MEVTTNNDHYKVLEVDYDASDENIILNYRRLALKGSPNKHKGDGTVTTKFQEINEWCLCFAVLSNPEKRIEYDFIGIYEIDKYTFVITSQEYLKRFKGVILMCNGQSISPSSIW